MAYTDPPRTWLANEQLTAALLNTQLRDQLKALSDAWTAYTPTWGATTTAPALGNGTITGSYMQVGKWVRCRIELTIGSTSTVGAGTYTLTLPVAAASSAFCALGSAMVYDLSVPQVYGMTAYRHSSGATVIALAGDSNRWGATDPAAPATGDVVSVMLSYQVA